MVFGNLEFGNLVLIPNIYGAVWCIGLTNSFHCTLHACRQDLFMKRKIAFETSLYVVIPC